MIPALVLTAGLATRLRPLSLVRAKAALPVAGEALVRRILRWLGSWGVTDAVLNLHHLPQTITSVVGEGADLDMRVRYSWEMQVLGSAGGPRRALPILGASFSAAASSSAPFLSSSAPFLIVNGDTLTDVDVEALVSDHRRSGALVTMALVPNPEPDKYGGVVVDADGAVSGFVKGGYLFVGAQVVNADAFASVPDNTPYESVRQLYPSLIAARRGSVRGFITSAEFFDIGTPGDYLRTSLLLESRFPLAHRSSKSEGGSPESRFIGSRTRIAASARVEDSVVWDDVDVGEDVRLHRCVVTDGVRVPAGSSWEHATIRVAGGDLADGERREGDLAIGPV